MDSLQAFARKSLEVLDTKSLRRSLRATGREDAIHASRDGKEFISFSSNDYFGLSFHPEVLAAIRSVNSSGAGASRLVSGNSPLYEKLESLLAEMHDTEAALVFGSGYLAHLGIIPALANANDLILADRLSHASMLDAARLSGATLMRFAHNNAEHAKLLLESHRTEFRHCLILTETVFSMDGDCAPVPELSALAREHDAWLVTDDAHGLGIAPAQPAQIKIGTLSKAAGSYGGYACAGRDVIEYLVNAARTLVYSTGLPPATLAAAHAALTLIRDHPALGQRALKNARIFTSALGLPEAQSAIAPVLLGEAERALAASAMLEAEGFLAVAIRPPTVPQGTARLRFAFSAQHRESDILRAAALLKAHGYA